MEDKTYIAKTQLRIQHGIQDTERSFESKHLVHTANSIDTDGKKPSVNMKVSDLAQAVIGGTDSRVGELLTYPDIKQHINDWINSSDISYNRQFVVATKTSVLHLACIFGSDTVVERLLENGAKTDVKDSNSDYAMHAAFRSKSDPTAKVELLVSSDRKNLDIKGWQKKTALHLASEKGYSATVRFLVEQGADGSCTDDMGCTAMHHAAQHNYVAIVSSLLKSNIDINHRDINGQTAFHTAVFYKNTDVVKLLLLNANCDTDLKNNSGDTAIHTAVLQGSVAVVNMIAFDTTSDLKQANKRSQTVLDLSALISKSTGTDDPYTRLKYQLVRTIINLASTHSREINLDQQQLFSKTKTRLAEICTQFESIPEDQIRGTVKTLTGKKVKSSSSKRAIEALLGDAQTLHQQVFQLLQVEEQTYP